mmetsp:Transcript_14718/g.16287  ORF Transcript_14718/g.16287 Transcript_14718/m.16287 type:complete len:108 (-) Transcript_14718:1035-1358(-)
MRLLSVSSKGDWGGIYIFAYSFVFFFFCRICFSSFSWKKSSRQRKTTKKKEANEPKDPLEEQTFCVSPTQIPGNLWLWFSCSLLLWIFSRQGGQEIPQGKKKEQLNR